MSSLLPMAVLSSPVFFSVAQDNLSVPTSSDEVATEPPEIPLPRAAAFPADGPEQVVVSPQRLYRHQQQYVGSNAAGVHPAASDQKWFCLPWKRRSHLVRLPPVELPPVGENVNSFWAIQVSNGEAARMVLYHFNFVPGQPQLTSRGTRQLHKMAELLQ